MMTTVKAPQYHVKNVLSRYLSEKTLVVSTLYQHAKIVTINI